MVNSNCQVRILLNQFQSQLSITKAVLPLLQHLEYPALDLHLGHRAAYKESSVGGGSVLTSNSKAATEIKQLAKVVQSILV
jgi:hypothetical protein